MSKFRSEVEEFLLNEMVQEDAHLILSDDRELDDLSTDNEPGLFEDTSSEDYLDTDDDEDIIL